MNEKMCLYLEASRHNPHKNASMTRCLKYAVLCVNL